jgi:anti-sigma factor RsiW
MVCESWITKLDTYLDGELPSEEMRGFDVHVHNCPSCSADALSRVQTKRAVQAAGRRFTPSVEFRRRMEQNIAAKPRRGRFGFAWIAATAAIAVLVVVGLTAAYNERERVGTEQLYGEVADLHVATLASSSLVDVISTDRHTVKPWFQGKTPSRSICRNFRTPSFLCWGGWPILIRRRERI